MVRESNNLFVPRTSLRSPGFFGPVTLTTAILLASIFTAPFDEDFSLVRISDPTFVGTVGIWGVCSRYHTENATTANPGATLTGNATFDALVHKQGKHISCSPAKLGWSFSLSANSTGVTSMPMPDTTLGVDVDLVAASSTGLTWTEVMTKSQSAIISIHVIAAILPALGLLILLIPYKKFEKSLPSLARFLKATSASLFLILVGTIVCIVSFFISISTAVKVRNNINDISNGGGVHAALGNLMWFPLVASVVNIPAIWSTRGRLGDK